MSETTYHDVKWISKNSNTVSKYRTPSASFPSPSSSFSFSSPSSFAIKGQTRKIKPLVGFRSFIHSFIYSRKLSYPSKCGCPDLLCCWDQMTSLTKATRKSTEMKSHWDSDNISKELRNEWVPVCLNSVDVNQNESWSSNVCQPWRLEPKQWGCGPSATPVSWVGAGNLPLVVFPS